MPDAAQRAGSSAAAEVTIDPIDLDHPLPAEIAGRTQGWLTGYRRYPVFGPRWARERSLAIGAIVIAVCVLLVGGALLGARGPLPLGALVQLGTNVVVPLFAGPWLGSLVRRRRLGERREWFGLVAVIASLVLATAAFNEWLAEPVKQQVAEWAGLVDETGQRKRVALTIGVQIRSPDDAASAPPPPNERSPQPNLATHLFNSVLAFSLAGGFALPRWRREREGLRALARERELARAQAERREAELRLSVLAAQVEPHFLFNTLAGVRSAIATDPARAAELVDRLVAYLRAAIPRLRSDGCAEATLGSQLEIAEAYLGLMAVRMPRLAFAVDVPAELRALPFPPLMLISLAENSVKHGAEPKIGPVRIGIRAWRRDDGRLEVCVEDDGAGFGTSATGTGIGLANIRERLRQMHGPRAELTLRARSEGGVAASIVIPGE